MNDAFWWEIELSGDNEEELLSIIDISGSIGSSFNPDGNVTAYYVNSKPIEYWLEKLNSLTPYFGTVKVLRNGKTEYRSWHKEWKEAFPPLEIGERFVVMAPWHRENAPRDRIPLYIYPATAFGTGYHESTQIALSLLEKNKDRIQDKKAADIGAGSGILSIAMLKLGAQIVVARDIDPTVLDEIRNNMNENEISDKLMELHTGDLLNDFDDTPDIITANILYEPLCSMLPDVARILTKEGFAVFSGLLLRERDDFIKNAAGAGLLLRDELSKNEWWGALFELRVES